MTLSRLLLITDRHLMAPSFEAALEAALRGGARRLQLREKDLTARGVLSLARAAQTLCAAHGARLVVNARADIARLAGAAGVHLPEDGLPPERARLSYPHAGVLCGVSVHSAAAARRAQNEGADYLLFGPVFSTASHPGQAPAGLAALREVSGATSLPVFAVGGVEAAQVRACREAGAYGVAVIRAVWQAPDVEAATRVLLNALGE
jgi:thiamine-phosphate pyrophosphorylase